MSIYKISKLRTGKFYIYGLFADIFPYTIRYIGKTNNPELRLYTHISKAKRNGSSRKDCWILSNIKKGISIKHIILDEFSCEDLCYKAEEYYVEMFRNLYGATLKNEIGGGTGCRRPTDEIRKKLSESHKGQINNRRGFKVSEETKQKLRESYYRRKERGEILIHTNNHTEETKNKIRQLHIARFQTKGVSDSTRNTLSRTTKNAWDCGLMANRKKKAI